MKKKINMFLKLDSTTDSNGLKFKLVYQLDVYFRENPDVVVNAQKIQLDPDRPALGIKGTHGLLGSDEWWRNIRNGVISSQEVTATVIDIFAPGRPSDSKKDSEMQLLLPDGSLTTLSMMANDPRDFGLFKIG
ncbi:hypothetical protein [Undibacterium sp. TC9W]|uniref:hypothetical protein n=1 Tax=Undibacterium sp. TC9W TaxID=3413053 RepID=UPI003BF15D51